MQGGLKYSLDVKLKVCVTVYGADLSPYQAKAICTFHSLALTCPRFRSSAPPQIPHWPEASIEKSGPIKLQFCRRDVTIVEASNQPMTVPASSKLLCGGAKDFEMIIYPDYSDELLHTKPLKNYTSGLLMNDL